MKNTTVDVLGTKYRVEVRKKQDDKYLEKEGLDGYTCNVRKLIVIVDLDSHEEWKSFDGVDRRNYEKTILRHEIIHAFLGESGLDTCSLAYNGGWARNEEMVDWIALQFPKILEAFKQVGCI